MRRDHDEETAGRTAQPETRRSRSGGTAEGPIQSIMTRQHAVESGRLGYLLTFRRPQPWRKHGSHCSIMAIRLFG